MNRLYLRSALTSIAAILLLIAPTGCFRHYYKIARQPSSVSQNTLDSLKNNSRYFILRSGDYAWHMDNITLSDDQKSIHCELKDLPSEHQLHLKMGEHHENLQYKPKERTRSVLNEVHFFITPEPMIKDGVFTLPVDKIQRIEVLQKDGTRTVASHLLGTVGVLGAIAAGALVIVALTSCPFVSPYDGEEFSLQGEIYGGAVYPQLARHDYIKLKMAPTPEYNLQLKISNELKEIQHTDLAELITVTHSKDVEIMSDQEGNLYSIKESRQPLSAYTKNYVDVSPLLAAKDGRIMEMNDSASENAVNLRFTKPSQANNAKLVLSVKNTFWLDRLYGKMLEGFGSYYNTFAANQKNKTVDELNKWVEEQKIPLTVAIKTKKGWKQVAALKTTGPVAFRDVIIPIDVSGITEPFVELRVSSGFMFWEMDYAGMDYSENEIFSIDKQRPVKATDEKGNDVTGELTEADGSHLDQPEPGNISTVTYNYHKPLEGQAQTYILHSKGWYETIREFQGPPDITFLRQFKKEGAFAKFSLELYNKEQRNHPVTVKN